MKYKVCFLVLWASVSIGFAQNKKDAQGKRHGKWIGYHATSKNVRYQGVFDHGIEIDTFYFYDDTKSKTVNAIRIFSNKGKEAYTKFFNGKYLVSEGAEINRKREGLWKYYHYNSSQIMTLEPYKSDLIDGLRIVYYPNGVVAEECFYVNGKKEGIYKKYATNKVVLEESFYVNNQLHGQIIVRDPEGNIVTKGSYQMDLPVGIWEYFENGKLLKKVDKNQKPEVILFPKNTNKPKASSKAASQKQE
jgi:antitoxin component YwqK of YwqJK toxin-antitoxin module